MRRRAAVPDACEFAAVERFGRATCPIGRARHADRKVDPVIEAGKVPERIVAVIQKPEGNPAGEPLGLGVVGALR